MKRIIAFLLAYILCFGLCACKDSSPAQDTPGTSASENSLQPENVNTTETNISSNTTENTLRTENTENNQPVHTHTWSAATCTAPKTCACGATEGSAKEHIWKEATYTFPKICALCGKTDGSPLEAPEKENYHGHVYTGGSNSKKYHYETNCAGKYSHEITWEEVIRHGLEPCGTCVLR